MQLFVIADWITAFKFDFALCIYVQWKASLCASVLYCAVRLIAMHGCEGLAWAPIQK